MAVLSHMVSQHKRKMTENDKKRPKIHRMGGLEKNKNVEKLVKTAAYDMICSEWVVDSYISVLESVAEILDIFSAFRFFLFPPCCSFSSSFLILLIFSVFPGTMCLHMGTKKWVLLIF